MLDIGRVCIKTSGRDAMQYGVIVEKVDETIVLLDGNVRRRKVNIQHIEPLMKTVDIKKGASTKVVQDALKDAGFEIREKKEKKEVNTTPRPRKNKDKETKDSSKDKKKK
ncbi:MAG: 50S ribosomal protein L14e [Candidatus Nanoarchaeia archaeon]